MRFSSCFHRVVLSAALATGLASAQLMSGKNFEVVRVEKVGISQGRVDSLAQILAQQQAGGRQVPPEAMQQVRWAVVDNLVGQELLKLEIKKLGLKAAPAKVDSLMKLFKAQFQTEAKFNAELKKSGITQAQFREKIEQQLLTEQILEKEIPYPPAPTEKEKQAYWELNKKKVAINDTISGAWIYLKTKSNAKDFNDKKELLKGLAAQVRLAKAPFATLAAQYSDDAEAKKTGGVISKFTAASKGKNFSAAVNKMKVGDISDVIVMDDRVAIFMLTEKNDGKYDSYKHQIEYILRMQAEQERAKKLKAYLDSLAKKYKVQYLNKDYTPPEAIGGSK